MRKTYLTYTILFTLLAGLIGCGNSTPPQEDAAVKTVNVETVTIQPREFSSYLRLVGTTEAANDVRLSAEANGRILRYEVDKGDFVRSGDLIAKIDNAQLREERDRLQSATEQARQVYLRQKKVWEEDSIGSEIQYLNAKYNYQQSKSALQGIEVQLQNTEVKAPFDARIEDILTEAGEMAAVGTPLVRLIASDIIKITAGVPARYANSVTPEKHVKIWFDTQVQDTLEGDLTFVGNSIDQQSRTFEIEIVLPNDAHRYKIGMLANLRLRTLHRPNSVVVGEEFVYESENARHVYVVNNTDSGEPIASKRRVQLGPRQQNNVLVESGLEMGERLITVGSSFLEDGMRINVVSER
ncbi:MAG: efflux RND transporter periplasmic adaptor subunit [Candidatus Marinimicrobia bacterium]|nr:efflux RND transporter periplasmic adaptor subunit [Candidatus Neomarinimicrobiota bacterium]MCF7828232.1 efflux RND transporter periplasmic adaptor subunit [Candidatus Neomarinimicrobiota bacterium]MCF7879593.1 efflux RND transporter periplasmic adaptor subunit [Candidatus Neomarinimicrobiota bacterium]